VSTVKEPSRISVVALPMKVMPSMADPYPD
jgi:hypothetical protein